MTLLERLKELSQQATPGPWEVSKDLPWVVVSPEPAKLGKGHVYVSCACGGGNNEENATFLSLALNALPDLIAVAEAAKKARNIRIPIECQHRLIRCYDEFLDEEYGRVERAIKTPVEVLFDVCGEINAALAKLEVKA